MGLFLCGTDYTVQGTLAQLSYLTRSRAWSWDVLGQRRVLGEQSGQTSLRPRIYYYYCLPVTSHDSVLARLPCFLKSNCISLSDTCCYCDDRLLGSFSCPVKIPPQKKGKMQNPLKHGLFLFFGFALSHPPVGVKSCKGRGMSHWWAGPRLPAPSVGSSL